MGVFVAVAQILSSEPGKPNGPLIRGFSRQNPGTGPASERAKWFAACDLRFPAPAPHGATLNKRTGYEGTNRIVYQENRNGVNVSRHGLAPWRTLATLDASIGRPQRGTKVARLSSIVQKDKYSLLLENVSRPTCIEVSS